MIKYKIQELLKDGKLSHANINQKVADISLDWKTQYCQNDNITQGSLQIQCDPHQITNSIFHRTKKIYICMETQKTPNSQSNLEKEKQLEE